MKEFEIKNAHIIVNTLSKLGFAISSHDSKNGLSYVATRENGIVLEGINTKYVTLKATGVNEYYVVFTDDVEIYKHNCNEIMEEYLQVLAA